MSNGFATNEFATWTTGHFKLAKKIRPRSKVWTYWFPVLSALFTVASFVSGYVIAVIKEDEYAWFSYISDGGAVPPESCVFGILLNYGCFFWALTAISKNIYLSQFMQFHNISGCCWTLARATLLICALVSMMGLTVVANFQEDTVPVAHGIGAWFTFFFGVFYVWLYIIICFAIRPKLVPNCLNVFRSIFALITTVALATHMVCTTTSVFVREDSDGHRPVKPTPPPYGPAKVDYDSPFYVNHLAATISEWVLALCFEVIVLTFAYELGSFTVTALTAEQLAETSEDPELTSIKPLN